MVLRVALLRGKLPQFEKAGKEPDPTTRRQAVFFAVIRDDLGPHLPNRLWLASLFGFPSATVVVLADGTPFRRLSQHCH